MITCPPELLGPVEAPTRVSRVSKSMHVAREHRELTEEQEAAALRLMEERIAAAREGREPATYSILIDSPGTSVPDVTSREDARRIFRDVVITNHPQYIDDFDNLSHRGAFEPRGATMREDGGDGYTLVDPNGDSLDVRSWMRPNEIRRFGNRWYQCIDRAAGKFRGAITITKGNPYTLKDIQCRMPDTGRGRADWVPIKLKTGDNWGSFKMPPSEVKSEREFVDHLVRGLPPGSDVQDIMIDGVSLGPGTVRVVNQRLRDKGVDLIKQTRTIADEVRRRIAEISKGDQHGS